MVRLYAILVTGLASVATAFPAFNTPNSVDTDGNVCPVVDRSGLSCPVLCVRDFSDCPDLIQPPSDCPAGEQLCDDGACYGSCDDVENPCLCGMAAGDVGAAYKACPAYSKTVTVKRYDPSTKQEQIEFSCAQDWGLVARNASFGSDTDIALWAANETVTRMWGDCPLAEEPQLTFTESFCLAFYGIIGAEVVLYLLWHVYKSIRERHAAGMRRVCSQQPITQSAAGDKLAEKDIVKSGPSSIDIPTDGIAQASQLPAGMMLLRGFKNDAAGVFMYYLTLLSTAGWIVLLAIIVADYYGAVKGGVAYGLLANSNTSMAVFIFIWHLSCLWLVVVLAGKRRLRNYFRIECDMVQAHVVQVEERQEEVIITEDNQNRLVRLVTAAHSAAVHRFGLDIVAESCAVRRDDASRMIDYRCTRYVMTEKTGSFECHAFALGDTHRALLDCHRGLSTAEAEERLARIGENFIRVYVPSFPAGLLEELFSFFYLYQLSSFWVWFYFNYYKLALVQLCVILLSAFIKVFIRLRSERRVKMLAERRNRYRVRRNGVWVELDTADLVPGDVVAVEANMEVMCDGCVLQGEVVVDESSLTGEAMPVRKLPLKNDTIAYDAQSSSSKAYSLYAGTRVLQCTGSAYAAAPTSLDTIVPVDSAEPQTQMLVLRTRTATDKGKLIQRILFPIRYSFVLDEQLRVSILALLLWAGVGFGLSIWLMGHDLTSWLYGVFVISQSLPVLLPASLVIGQSVAAERLRRKKIYSIDLPRINLAGKVRLMLFDKTGTLTHSGMQYYGVQEIDHGVFAEAQQGFNRLSTQMQNGLAACHAATEVDGQLIGNPVDVEQFRASGWQIQNDRSNPHSLDTLVSPDQRSVHVIRRFEFEHARQAMSVAVQDESTGHVHVFIKGSFERIKSIANTRSVPTNYDAVTAVWAKEGCYVLALAHRDLGPADLGEVTRMPRAQLEAGCNLVSLLLFRNTLKEDTPQAIAELRGGDVRSVMVTGDTALTAAYIARECGMVDAAARVVLGTLENDEVVWRDTATDAVVDNIDAELRTDAARDACVPLVELAVTESAFNRLCAEGSIRGLLLNIRIFARMTPQGKVQCVNLHMERAVTGMCGDGGNDTGALRAAHVGLALSDAEASIVSPFSSANHSVMSCVTLLREGRAGLATSLAAYKFLVNYACTMSMLELTQFYFSVIVPQAVWIMVDGFCTSLMLISITQAQTARRLAPSRPTGKLIGAHTLASIWGQAVINYAFLFGSIGLLFAQSWFRCHEFDSSDIDTSLWWLLGDNFEAEVISIVCLFQFANAAGVYNFGYRYRRAWVTNYMLVLMYCTFLAIVSALTLADPNRFGCVFRINCGNTETVRDLGYSASTVHISDYNSPIGHNVMPRHFRWTLWAMCVVNIVVCLAYEKFVVLGPVGRRVKAWWIAKHGDNKLQFKL
ncbi:hypothetical protein IWW50_000275 [Coemansia erecta]|nr:hypothetical protein GGF43_000412 [Coemansia sp. RSA 2618]KAJ2830456.1 hypothetical protein IWW50_000275 [Coemansia erecta]